MAELGIDIDELMENAVAELFTDKDMKKLKSMYTL